MTSSSARPSGGLSIRDVVSRVALVLFGVLLRDQYYLLQRSADPTTIKAEPQVEYLAPPIETSRTMATRTSTPTEITNVQNQNAPPVATRITKDAPFPITNKKVTTSSSKSIIKHPCLNQDFESVHDTAVVTMNTGGGEYLNGSLVLGRSIVTHTRQADIDLVILELSTKPLLNSTWKALRPVGWKRCIVERIPPPKDRKTNAWFIDQFTKLHVWQMTMYKSIVYMDADTLVINKGMDDLLTMPLDGYKMGVSRDYRDGHDWADTFNLGVFKVNPNMMEYQRLMQLKEENTIVYEETMSEQGWLNVVYKGKWKEIGFENNANLAAVNHVTGTDRIDDIHVVHFTLPKPWKGCSRRITDDGNFTGKQKLRRRLTKRRSEKYCHLWYDALDNYTIWSDSQAT